MFLSILYYIIISFIFIFVVHNLYEYFKNNLTVPREKDMIHKPIETYNKIFETLKTNGNNNGNNNENNNESKTKMKSELKNFLDTLKNKNKSQDNKPQQSMEPQFTSNDKLQYTPF